MKISASILATDQNNVINELDVKNHLYDYVHVDIGDNKFCPTYGVSPEVLNVLNRETNYKLDVHLMIDENPDLLKNYINTKSNIIKVSHHVESKSINQFIKMMGQQSQIKTGIGILGNSNLNILKNYITNDNVSIDFVLLLCVNPGFSNQDPIVPPIQRTQDFINKYPNFNGEIMVDGGVSDKMLTTLNNLGVHTAVQGGAIFG